LGRDHSARTSHTPKSTSVLLLLCTDSWQRLLSQTFGLKLVGVSWLSRRPSFFMPSWCRLLSACASTSCTRSRFEMRRTQVYLLGVWSLTSVCRSWQIFQTRSPPHESQILLAFRVSWSLMPSCSMRLRHYSSASTRSPHSSCIIIFTGCASLIRHWSCFCIAYDFHVSSSTGSQSYRGACLAELDRHQKVSQISSSQAEWWWWLSFIYVLLLFWFLNNFTFVLTFWCNY